MTQITVKICSGTTCFVMGGAGIQELTEIIPRKYGDKVSVSAQSCLGICSGEHKYAKAPYVMVDEDIITEATIEKVFVAINKKLEQ